MGQGKLGVLQLDGQAVAVPQSLENARLLNPQTLRPSSLERQPIPLHRLRAEVRAAGGARSR